MSDTTPVSAANEASAITASEMLRAARQTMELTQQRVAEQLYLKISVIAHIDAGEIDQIGKQAFVRGYLRSYAKLVNLDGDLVIQQYSKLQTDSLQPVEIRGVTEETVGPGNFTGPVVKTGIVGLVGLLLIILVVWLVASLSEQPSVAGTEAIPELTQPPPEPQKLQQETISTSQHMFESETVIAHTKSDTDTALATAKVAQVTDKPLRPEGYQTSEQQKPTVPHSPTFIEAEAAGSDKLVLTFSGECWVEIVNNFGTTIYNDLNHSGDVLNVSGAAPFEVLLGKATVVNITFNNQEINFEADISGSNVAKIRIGG